jgi:hypothetical protein
MSSFVRKVGVYIQTFSSAPLICCLSQCFTSFQLWICLLLPLELIYDHILKVCF